MATIEQPPEQQRTAPDSVRRARFIPRTAAERAEAKEDYALRKIPNHYRRSPLSIGLVVSGAVWSVFSFALGGQLALAYGLPTTLIALAIGFLAGSAIAVVITRVTTIFGIDIDLLSRGSGYGFMGSAISSLVYAVNFLMYCAFEAAFVAQAVNAQWPSIDLNLLYVLASLVMVPLNWYGFTQNDLLQRVTWPLFIAGLVYLGFKAFDMPTPESFGGPVTAGAMAGALAAVLPTLTVQGLLIGDWSRFARRRDLGKIVWIGPLVAIGGVFLIEAPLGALFALYTNEASPGVYAATLMGTAGVLWMMVTQVRIQNLNYYSSSLALANFASRALRWVPGRQFWILVTAAITAIATVSGVINHLLDVLTFLGVFLLAWAGTLLADIVVVKRRMGLPPRYVEHRRGYLRTWGWPAIVALVIGCAVGAVLTLGKIPDDTWGPLIGQVLAFVLASGIYIATMHRLGTRWSLLARQPEPGWIDDGTLSDAQLEAPENFLVCGRCGGSYMKQDMLTCPVVASGVICSVCCSAHATCHDACKDGAAVRAPALETPGG